MKTDKKNETKRGRPRCNAPARELKASLRRLTVHLRRHRNVLARCCVKSVSAALAEGKQKGCAAVMVYDKTADKELRQTCRAKFVWAVLDEAQNDAVTDALISALKERGLAMLDGENHEVDGQQHSTVIIALADAVETKPAEQEHEPVAVDPAALLDEITEELVGAPAKEE